MAIHDADSLTRRGEHQANVAIAFLIVTWVFVALRVWTRAYVIANFGWDDGTIVMAAIVFSIYCATMLYIESNGGGTHITSVSQLVMLTKWAIVGEATYIITIMVMKISLGIFFARIVVKTWQLWTIYFTVAVNILSSAASFFYCLFRCGTNLDAYVFYQLADKCTPRALDRFFAYQQASFTTLTDCIFATLPIFILWNSSMDTTSKISVGLILSLAALGSICSMIRFQYVDGLTQIDDFFWNATNIAIWSTIEPGTGIIASCLATLRPFLKSFVSTVRSIRSSALLSEKRSSRSNLSAVNSANQQNSAENNLIHPNMNCYRNSTEAEQTCRDDGSPEMTDFSKRKGSAGHILTQAEPVISPWPSEQNQRTYPKTPRKSYSRSASDRYALDRPLPPLPLDPPERPK